MKLTKEKKNFILLGLIVPLNLIAWSASFKFIPQDFMFFAYVIFSFVVALFVTFRIQERMERRKAAEEDARWSGRTYGSMKDWMKSNPY